MPVTISASTLLAFGFVLTRMSAVALFATFPGSSSTPAVAKLALAAGLSLVLLPVVQIPPELTVTITTIVLYCAVEFCIGAALGTVVGFVNEMIAFGVQSLAVQAGYAYASSVDPNSQADSSTLQVIAHLASGAFFFMTGLHHTLLRALAGSFAHWPPGPRVLDSSLGTRVIEFAGFVLQQGVRLALPVIGLLLLTDLMLALLSRIQPHLQLLGLSFPVKSLIALLTLAATVHLFFISYSTVARVAGRIIRLLLGVHVAE